MVTLDHLSRLSLPGQAAGGLRMDLLLDFLNIKAWNIEALFGLYKDHGLYVSEAGYKQGYEFSSCFEGFLPNLFFFFMPDDPFAASLLEQGIDVCLPGDERYQELFDYLTTLQSEWGKAINFTVEHGPNFDFLNYTMSLVDIRLAQGANPWDAMFEHDRGQITPFEQFLEFDFLQPFLVGQGKQYKKLRVCKNPDCGKWFIYNRPKQLYCNETCRHNYHNHIKIESGYMAEYQRKGREEKPLIYIR